MEIAGMAGHQFHGGCRALAGPAALQPYLRAIPCRRIGAAWNSSRALLLQNLEKPVDAAITTGAGYPLDLTYYQCIKGITAASHIVRDGGRILVVGPARKAAAAPSFRACWGSIPIPRRFSPPLRERTSRSISGNWKSWRWWPRVRRCLIASPASRRNFAPNFGDRRSTT